MIEVILIHIRHEYAEKYAINNSLIDTRSWCSSLVHPRPRSYGRAAPTRLPVSINDGWTRPPRRRYRSDSHSFNCRIVLAPDHLLL